MLKDYFEDLPLWAQVLIPVALIGLISVAMKPTLVVLPPAPGMLALTDGSGANHPKEGNLDLWGPAKSTVDLSSGVHPKAGNLELWGA